VLNVLNTEFPCLDMRRTCAKSLRDKNITPAWYANTVKNSGWAMRRRPDNPVALGGLHQIAYDRHGFSMERPTDIARLEEARGTRPFLPLFPVPSPCCLQHRPIARLGAPLRMAEGLRGGVRQPTRQFFLAWSALECFLPYCPRPHRAIAKPAPQRCGTQQAPS
jgi:hypothetical protein